MEAIQLPALIIGGLAALFFGGDLLVRGASGLATALGIPPIVVGLTVVAFGTSAPEMAVSVQASLQGNMDIAIANIVGSNIFNLLLILGASGIIMPLTIHWQVLRREVPLMLLVSVAFYVFCFDGLLAIWEATILSAAIVLYSWWLIRAAKADPSEAQAAFKPGGKIVAPIQFLAGIGLVIVGADFLVSGASAVAAALGMSEAVIGLTIVAAGTSLPEFVASVTAAFRGEADLAIGNVVGSNIFNILGIGGISGLLSGTGLSISTSIVSQDLPIMIGCTILAFYFFWSGRRLTRGEGVFLILSYSTYTFYLIQQAS